MPRMHSQGLHRRRATQKRRLPARKLPLFWEQLEDRRLLAVVPWSGDLPDGTIWRAGDVQHLTSDVRVPAGSTLTIEPGAIVKFGAFHYDLTVAGTLNARGTADQNIIFTEFRDDVGGDTNGNGAANSPAPGNWGRIEVANTGSATIEFADIRYGGYDSPGEVTVRGGALQLANSTISHSSTQGVRIEQSNPVLTNNVYRNNLQAALSMDLKSNPVITSGGPVNATGNAVNGLLVDSGTMTTDGFWNDPDIVYVTNGDITVDAGTKLTISPGQIIKVGYFHYDLFVNGTLDAQGTTAAPIVFTEFRDDSVGGDTNNNGVTSSPSPGNWGRIELAGAANIFRNVNVRYGGYDSAAQLRVRGGELNFTDGTIEKSSTSGMRIETSNPTITRVKFIDNVNAAVRMDLASNPQITGSSPVVASGNAVNGVLVDSGNLVGNGFWDDSDIVYVTDGDITVPAGQKLTIGAGQVVKIGYFHYDLIVNGTLDAQGTTSAPIVFTEFRDDTVGGDTNQNANASAPSPGNWGRIELAGPNNVLQHVDVRYGGYNSAAQLHVKGGSLHLSNGILQKSATAGLRIETSNPTIANVQFLDNVGAAARMDLASNPEISGNSPVVATGNAINGLLVDAGTLVGDGAWNDPDIVYVTDGDITVPSGQKLTIAPGQIIKVGYFHYDLFVNGTLDAQGTAAAPIVFTELRDDTVGGDTNNNGTASVPAPGNWGRIELAGPANVMKHVSVRYGGYDSSAQLRVKGGQLNFDTGITQQSVSAGLRIETSNPTIANLQFLNNRGAAARMDLASNPTITGSSPVVATGNAVNGLLLDGGTLPGDAQWNDPDMVYVTDGDIVVPAGNKLTIAAGQVVKVGYFHYDLFIEGQLDAQGTASAPIVFTEARDDSVRGDTNNDQSNSVPSPGNWGRIELKGAGNTLNHVDVRYGGYSSLGMIQASNGEATLSNSIVRSSVVAGVAAEGSGKLTVTNTVVAANLGAGALAFAGGKIDLVNDTLDGNLRGASADGATSTINITNSLVTNHSHTGLHSTSNGLINARYNDVFNPTASSGNYLGLADQTDLNGNFSADPKYVSRANFRFDLLSRSPALDTGDSNVSPATDALGLPRFNDPGVDDLGTGPIAFVDLGPFERQNVSDPLNLIVESSTISASQVHIDETVTIGWTVRNNEFVPASGDWTDSVFASEDNRWDLGDTLVGTTTHRGGLDPGATYNSQVTFTVPPKTEGDLFFIIRTDSRRALRESIESDNEGIVSTELVIPELTVDTPFSSAFSATQKRQYFRITPPESRTLITTLDSAAQTGSTAFYAREGAIPSVTEFDVQASSSVSPDQKAQIPETGGGTIYFLAQAGVGAAATSAFTVTATLPGFKLNRISPTRGGNTGQVTIQLEGTDLLRIAQVTLIAPDNSVIQPIVTRFGDANHLFATFDLNGLAPAKYDVRVVAREPVPDFAEDGSLTIKTQTHGDATLADAFEVVAGSAASATAELLLPSAARFGGVFPFHVEVRNDSSNDVVSPIISVHSSNGTPLSTSTAINAASPTELQFLALSPNGRPTVLRPGEKLRVPLYGLAIKEPSSRITATLAPSGSTSLNWDSLEAQYRDDSNLTEWASTWANFKQLVGDTFEELHQAMRLAADELAAGDSALSLVSGDELISDLLDRSRLGQTDIAAFLPFPTGMDSADPLGLFGSPNLAGPVPQGEGETEPPEIDDNRDTCKFRRPRSAIVLAAEEAWTETAVIGVLSVRNGTYAASFFVDFLQSSSPKYDVYSSTSELAQGNAIHRGIKNSETTIRVMNSLWDHAMRELRKRMNTAQWGSVPVGQRIDIETMSDYLEIPLTDLFKPEQLDSALSPFSSLREGRNPDFYFADALHYGGENDASSIPGLLAGGVGKTNPDFTPRRSMGSDQFGDDRRTISGSIILRRVNSSDGKTYKITAESLFRLFVKDTVDFCPGDLGDNFAVKAATVPLKNLEANGWAFDIGFETEVSTIPKSEVLITKTKKSPPLFCPAPQSNPQGSGEGEGTSCEDSGDLVPTIRSRDPNDITGPAGVGDQHSILPGTLMPYRVRFENDPEQATAPAFDVTITNQLDTDMDWATFELGSIGFGSAVVDVPVGHSSYSTFVSYANPDGSPLQVHVSAQLDLNTGIVSVAFRSLDPLTGLPPLDPFAGFLPPNDETHRGEGFYTYFVRPKQSLASGTKIENSASIVFDINDPILTNTALNTIDDGAPSSNVVALPATSNTKFTLSWTGSDEAGAAGIAQYDVFVSDDGGPFTLFADNTANTSAEFTGVVGHRYRFYSVATDGLGHVEAAPASPDTETLIAANPWRNSLDPRDVNPDGNVVPLDALAVINELNNRRFSDPATGRLLERTSSAVFFYDVTGDGFATPLDALNVINFLNARSAGEGESALSPIWLSERATPANSEPTDRVTQSESETIDNESYVSQVDEFFGQGTPFDFDADDDDHSIHKPLDQMVDEYCELLVAHNR